MKTQLIKNSWHALKTVLRTKSIALNEYNQKRRKIYHSPKFLLQKTRKKGDGKLNPKQAEEKKQKLEH